MARFSRRKSAGYVALARMPPPLAAAKKTYSGFSLEKKRSTALTSVRSNSFRCGLSGYCSLLPLACAL